MTSQRRGRLYLIDVDCKSSCLGLFHEDSTVLRQTRAVCLRNFVFLPKMWDLKENMVCGTSALQVPHRFLRNRLPFDTLFNINFCDR